VLKLVRLFLVILGCTCAACTEITSYYPPLRNWFSPPPRSYYSASRSRHRKRGEHWRVAHNHPPARNSAVTTVAARSEGDSRHAASAPVPASKPPVTLSLAGDSMDRSRAEQTLEAVRSKLGRVHARHLTKAEEETYNRADQLAGRAQQALGDNDCAAASSLAAKASSLASGLRDSEL